MQSVYVHKAVLILKYVVLCVILTLCRCPYGYIGSYCEIGKSRGAPPGTGTANNLPVSNILLTDVFNTYCLLL